MIVDFQSIDQKSTVHWKVKLWLFGQNQVSKITIHQNMSKYETCSSRNQKVKISFEKSKFSNLEIFLSVENFMFYYNFEPIFHHDARWFKRNFQHESCRYPWDLKHFFKQLLLEMLGSQVINPWSHGHETKTLSEILSIFSLDFDLTSWQIFT